MNALIEACVDELNKQDIQLVHHERSVMDGLLRLDYNTNLFPTHPKNIRNC